MWENLALLVPLIPHKCHGSCTAIMLSESFTSVSHLIYTEPSELLRLWLSEPIAPESVVLRFVTGDYTLRNGTSPFGHFYLGWTILIRT